MRKDNIEQLREDLDDANEKIDKLVAVLVESQIMSVDYLICHTFYRTNLMVLDNKRVTSAKLQLILDHLELEFEWVDCQPHYELKKKEDE
ncbi:MAG: hypothetical protein ACW97P_09400 [Candidatus Hodarchaeales archaeon]|jgi:hypothetical protein